MRALGLFGTFDVANYGDCIFPDIISCALERLSPKTELKLYSPTSSNPRIGGNRTVHESPGQLSRLGDLDIDGAILAGGETLVYGRTACGVYCGLPQGALSAGLRTWMVPAALKAVRGIPWAVHSVGATHTVSPVSKALVAAIGVADYASVRDQESAQLLRSYGATALVDCDIGFTIPRLRSTAEWTKVFNETVGGRLDPGAFIVVQASRGYLRKGSAAFLEAVARTASEHGKSLVVLPICLHLSDQYLAPSIGRQLRRYASKVLVLGGVRTTMETASVLANAYGFIGTSMHGAITSLAFKKPSISFVKCGRGKHSSTLAAAGYPGLCTADPTAIPAMFQHSCGLDLQGLARRASQDATLGIERALSSLLNRERCEPSHGAAKLFQEAEIFDTKYAPLNLIEASRGLVFKLLRSHPALIGQYELFRSSLTRLTWPR